MSWDTLPKDNLEYLLSKLKTDVLDNKVDTEAGKGLSSNDYTTADKNKLAGIAANATKVESSETNGNIKIDTVETQVYDDSEIQELIDTDETETDYANPLTFETLQAQTAKNTKIKLEPIQDLHGYDKPWTGGAGKNKLPLTVESIKAVNTSGGTWSGNIYTHNNGVVFTILTDSDNNVTGIKANGTSNGTSGLNLILQNTSNIYTGYILNCSNITTQPQSIAVQYYEGSTFKASHILSNSSENYEITNEGTNISIFVRIENGQTVNNLIFNPMLRLSTESDATFQPYTNICPISGHDQIDILGCGVNIWDEEWEEGIYSNSTGEKIANTSSLLRIRTKNPIRVSPNTTYYKISPTTGFRWINYYDSKMNFIGADQLNIGNTSFTTRENAYYITSWTNSNDYGLTYNNDISINYPSTDTSYHAHQSSNNLSIDLPSTVYSGVLDLESGELVVDKKYIKGLNNYTWYYVTSYTTLPFFEIDATVSPSVDLSKANELICNKYDSVIPTTTNTEDAIIGFIPNAHLRIRDTRYTDGTTFGASLSDCEICYPLATPITLYISPEHLKLLKAQNNLTTSQYTQIKVTYRNGVFATLEELSDTAQDIYDEISGDTTTIEGNPINFTTREKQKSKSTIIDLEPIQDLHGFTKPWVGGAGKNLLPLDITTIKSINTPGTWSGNTYTIYGVAFTILTDADNNIIGIRVKRNSSGSDNAIFNLCTNGTDGKLSNLQNKNIILNGCPSAGSQSYYLQFYLYDGTNVIADIGNGGSSTFSPSNLVPSSSVRIVARTEVSPNNEIFYPMIRLSSVTDATFEPYTNIASISGRTSVDIDGCGKNLWNNTQIWTSVKITFDNGVYKVNSNTNACCINCTAESLGTMPVSLKVGEEYRIVYESENAVVSNVYSCCLYYDGTWKNFNSLTFVPTKPVVSIGLALYGTFTTSTVFKNIQLSLSSNSRYYELYTPSIDLTISFGTTVYGGRLNVESGELVVDRKCDVIEDSTNVQSLSTLTNTTRLIISTESQSDFSKANLAISNYLPYVENYTLDEPHFYMSSSGIVAFFPGVMTGDQWKTYIANNPLQVVYELATPQTIQLTPQQVQLLKGINNISTTGTAITVTFKNGSVAHLDDLPDFTDYDKEKLASIDTLAITLDLLTHTLIVTQDI